jgi:hypothetical protein
MKRSYAIDSLQEFLDTVVYGNPKAASAIILHMEMLGMLPPHNGYAEKIYLEEASILNNFKWEKD